MPKEMKYTFNHEWIMCCYACPLYESRYMCGLTGKKLSYDDLFNSRPEHCPLIQKEMNVKINKLNLLKDKLNQIESELRKYQNTDYIYIILMMRYSWLSGQISILESEGE